MIQKGDIPNTDPKENKNLNKFIMNQQGFRGLLVAVNNKKDQAVILTDKLLLVYEIDPEAYPMYKKTINKIPKDFDIIHEDF